MDSSATPSGVPRPSVNNITDRWIEPDVPSTPSQASSTQRGTPAPPSVPVPPSSYVGPRRAPSPLTYAPSTTYNPPALPVNFPFLPYGALPVSSQYAGTFAPQSSTNSSRSQQYSTPTPPPRYFSPALSPYAALGYTPSQPSGTVPATSTPNRAMASADYAPPTYGAHVPSSPQYVPAPPAMADQRHPAQQLYGNPVLNYVSAARRICPEELTRRALNLDKGFPSRSLDPDSSSEGHRESVQPSPRYYSNHHANGYPLDGHAARNASPCRGRSRSRVGERQPTPQAVGGQHDGKAMTATDEESRRDLERADSLTISGDDESEVRSESSDEESEQDRPNDEPSRNNSIDEGGHHHQHHRHGHHGHHGDHRPHPPPPPAPSLSPPPPSTPRYLGQSAVRRTSTAQVLVNVEQLRRQQETTAPSSSPQQPQPFMPRCLYNSAVRRKTPTQARAEHEEYNRRQAVLLSEARQNELLVKEHLHNHGRPVDIYNSPTAWRIHLDLPGVKKQDVTVSWNAPAPWNPGHLAVSGDIPQLGDDELQPYRVTSERRCGPFGRPIQIPGLGDGDEVDEVGITYDVVDGVLVIVVPKVQNDWVEVEKDADETEEATDEELEEEAADSDDDETEEETDDESEEEAADSDDDEGARAREQGSMTWSECVAMERALRQEN